MRDDPACPVRGLARRSFLQELYLGVSEDVVPKSTQTTAESTRAANRRTELYLDRALAADAAVKVVTITPRRLGRTGHPGIAAVDCNDDVKSEEVQRKPVEPDKAEIFGELQRILASKTFAKAFRQRELLSWVVSRWLENREDQLDSYTIAMAVFHRDRSFDAGIDPIVRVETSRLRRQLQKYYSGEGSGYVFRIDLPSGAYTPQVCYTPLQNPAVANQLGTGPNPILILPFEEKEGPDRSSPTSREIYHHLILLLTQEKSVHVLSRLTATQMDLPVDIVRIKEEFRARFIIGGAITREAAVSHLIVHLTETADGFNIWSGYYPLTNAAVMDLSRHIVADVVGKVRETMSID